LPQPWEAFSKLFLLNHSQIEEDVGENDGAYKGLPADALYTSLEDFYKIFQSPFVEGDFLDVGCGVGAGPLFYGTLFPQRRAFGLECQLSRLRVGEAFVQKQNLSNVSLIQGDLLSASLPEAHTVFLYFPTGPVLDRLLDELYQSRELKVVIAIESHGDLLPRLELEPWLQLVSEIPLTSKRHYPFARIYQRIQATKVEGPFMWSFKDLVLYLNDGKSHWIGESYGMEWEINQAFNLKVPPRTVHRDAIQRVGAIEDLSKEQKFLWELRKRGLVRILTSEHSFSGFLRKIHLWPTFAVEISSGETIEWKSIQRIFLNEILCYDSSQAYFFLPPVL
jgi:SAM-dependent methyltransferase